MATPLPPQGTATPTPADQEPKPKPKPIDIRNPPNVSRAEYYQKHYADYYNSLKPELQATMLSPQKAVERQLGYEPTFAQDPKAVVEAYQQIKATPAGAPLPPHIANQREQITQAYKWFEFRNKGKPPAEWGYLPGDDPGLGFLSSIAGPQKEKDEGVFKPGDAVQEGFALWNDVSPDERKTILADPNFDITTYPIEMRDQILNDPNFDWSRLPKWQKAYYDIMSNPKIMASPMALAGARAGAVFGVPGQILGAAGGYTLGLVGGQQYDPTSGVFEQPTTVAGMMAVLNKLAEGAEQSIGYGSQLADAISANLQEQPTAAMQEEAREQLSGLIFDPQLRKAAWEAGRFQYETMDVIGSRNWIPALALLFAVSEQNTTGGEVVNLFDEIKNLREGGEFQGIRFAKPGEDFVIGQASPVSRVDFNPVTGEHYDPSNAFQVLYQTRKTIHAAIVAGEDPKEVVRELFGVHGQFVGSTMMDFAGQMAIDPLEKLPTVTNLASAKLATALGNNTAARAFMETHAPFEAARRYKTLVQTGDVSPGFKYEDMGGFSRWIAGVNDKGQIKAGPFTQTGLLDAPAQKRRGLLQNIKEDWAAMTPEARAREGAGMFYNNISAFISTFDDPKEIARYFSTLSKGDMKLWSEMGNKVANSPEWYTILPALKDFKGEKMDGLLAAWDVAQPKREALLKISDVLGQEPGRLIEDLSKRGTTEQDFQRIVQQLQQSKSPSAKALLDQIASGEFSSATLADIVDAFTGDGALYWHPDQWKAALLDTLGSHFDEWVVDKLGLGKDTPETKAFFRTAHLLKSAQSVLLLGGSPGYALQNGMSGMVHRAATGIYGYMTTKQIDSWLDRFGVRPARLEEGVGIGGIVEQASTKGSVHTENIEKAMKGKGALGRAQQVVSAIGRGMPFNKLSSWFERVEGKNGYMIAMRDMWSQTWRRGVGFSEMTPQLRGQIEAAGINPNSVYALIEAGMSKAEVEKFIFSRQAGVMSRTLVADAASAVGMTPSQASRMLEKIGVLDDLDANLLNANTPDQIRQAFTRATRQAQDFADMQTSRDMLAIAEDVTNKVQGEGAVSALDLVQQVNSGYFDAWQDHYARFGEMFQDLQEIDDIAVRNKAIELNYRISDQEFRRINSRTAANYKGIFDAWGKSGNPSAMDMLAAIADSDAAMKQAYDFMRQTRRSYFERFSGQDFRSLEAQAEWNDGQARINAEFDRAFEIKHNAEVRMGGSLEKLYGEMYGPAAGEAARLWWQDYIKFSDEIVKREQKFRASLAKMDKPTREAAKQKYYSTDKVAQIAELEQINKRGIERLERIIKRGGSGQAPTLPPTPAPPAPAPSTPPPATPAAPSEAKPIDVAQEIADLTTQAEARRAAETERITNSMSVAEEFGYGARDEWKLMASLRKYGDADITSWDDPRLTPDYMRETLQKRAAYKAEQQMGRERMAVETALSRAQQQAIEKPRSELPPVLNDAMLREATRIADVVTSGEPGRRHFAGGEFIGATGSTYPKWYNDLQASVGGKKKLLAVLDKIIEDAGKDKGKVVERVKEFLLMGMRHGDAETNAPPDLNVLLALGADDATMNAALGDFNEMMRTNFTMEQVLRPDALEYVPNYEGAYAELSPVFDADAWLADMNTALRDGDLNMVIERIEQVPDSLQDTPLPSGETYREFMSRVFDETAQRSDMRLRDETVATRMAEAEIEMEGMQTRADAAMSKHLLREKLQEAFGLTDEQANGYMEVSESIAAWYSKHTGEPADDFYARYYEDVRTDVMADADALAQQLEPVNRRMTGEEVSNYARALVRGGADELRRAVVNEPVKADRIAILDAAHKLDAGMAEGVARRVSDTLFQEVWHGSPHKFDKFTLDHIGSGEGAQAYGWGLYFAEKKQTAQWYRETLGANSEIQNINTRLSQIAEEMQANGSSTWQPKNDVGFALAEEYRSLITKRDILVDGDHELGQLYRADIPDEGYLLWDKRIAEQPQLLEKMKSIGVKSRGSAYDWLPGITGKDAYRQIAADLGGDKAASLALLDTGITGIKYFDGSSRGKGEGSFNYVIFDDEAVKVLETYYQSGLRAKGSVTFDGDGIKATIKAFESGDFSTVIHENAHIFRRVMADVAARVDDPKVKADLRTIEEWAGVKDGKWDRAAEEKFARGFEKYIADGQAPTPKLRAAFESFKTWMLEIYKTITGSSIDVEITPEVRAVFDRMLGDEQARAESIQQRLSEGGDARLPAYERLRQVWDKLDSDSQMQALDWILHKTMIDPLSGVETLVAKGVSTKPAGWVEAVSDLNALTAINNTWGHGAGDLLIKGIGRIAKVEVEKVGGRAFRVGGDEFSYWFPDHASAKAALDAIDQAVYREVFNVGGENRTGFSVSYGIADTLEAADKALYSDKVRRVASGQRPETRDQMPPSIVRAGDMLAGIQQSPRPIPIRTDGVKEIYAETILTSKGRATADLGKGYILPVENIKKRYKIEVVDYWDIDGKPFTPVFRVYEELHHTGNVAPSWERTKKYPNWVGMEGDKLVKGLGKDKPNELFQSANYPFGTMDNASGFKSDGAVMDEGWRQQVNPLLQAMQEAALNKQANEKPMDGAYRDLSPEGQQMLRQYIKRVTDVEMPTVKMSTMKWGESQRDFALLNYNRRYGFDTRLETVLPYQFFYTRSMMTWAMRGLDKPVWYARYARIRNMQNKHERDIPERLRNKFKIPAPWLPDWMGDALYIDPLQSLFTPANFLRPVETMLRDKNYKVIETERILQEWAADGTVSQEAILQAAQTQSGELWERATAEAGIRRESEVSNPFDFMAQIFGPAWYLSTPLNLMGIEVPGISKGDPLKVSNLPLTSTARALETVTKDTWAEPIGKFIGLAGKPEQMLREHFNMPEFGEYGDYYINRQLANMVKDGLISPDQASTAMIERNGEIFEQARERVKMELAMRVPLAGTAYALTHEGAGAAAQAFVPSLFGSGLLPQGELEYRGLKEEWNAAWKMYDAGDKDAVNNFFEEHPEYQAYLDKGKDPDELLRSNLVGSIWDAYMELGETNQKAARAQMGEEFQQAFLNKETRSYESLDVYTLSMWARMLGAMVPRTEQTAPALDTPQRDMPQLNLYDPQVTEITDQFFSERREDFGDYYMLEQGYYSLPKSERASYLLKFPRLKEYWDWKDGYYEKYPELKPVFQGKVFKTVNTDTWSPALVQYVTLYAMTGDPLPNGAYAALEQEWIRAGRPYGSYETWLDAQVVPAMLYNGGQ